MSLSIINQDINKKNGKLNKDEKSEVVKRKKNLFYQLLKTDYGKRTSHYDYRVTNRGGKGIIGIVTSQRNGNVSSSFPANEGDESFNYYK